MIRDRFYVFLLLSFFTSCDCGGVDSGDLPNPISTEAADPIALKTQGQLSCATDLDCESGNYCFQGSCAFACSDDVKCASGSCDERGRCVSGASLNEDGSADASPVAPQVLNGVRIVGSPETIKYVQSGQKKVIFEFELSDEVGDSVAYILRRSDEDATIAVVQLMPAAGKKITLEVPLGEIPKQEVFLNFTSAVGTLNLLVLNEESDDGFYKGNVQIDTFGSTGIAVEFSIVTQPDGVRLEEAQEAWLVLPVDPALVFSPIRGGDLQQLAQPLEYDDFTKTWVVTFDGGFDLSDGAILNFENVEQVRRQMRFELKVENNTVTGDVRDTWIGLYESRSADGVITLSDVTYRGRLNANRQGKAMSSADIDKMPNIPQADPKEFAAPDLMSCDNAEFAIGSVNWGNKDWNCSVITTVAEFKSASPAEQAECAIAITQSALTGATTAKQIQIFLDGGDVNGQSFSDFMADCSQGLNGLCRPTSSVTCGRELVSFAYRVQASDSLVISELLQSYLESSRETFLGRQFGSLQSDTETRLKWLKSSDYPAIITAAVRDLNERLLDEWQINVLDVHFEVLRGQFDSASLVTLAREPEGDAAINTRGEVLLEMNQSFRTAVESLTTATQRWDVLFLDTANRKEKADFVSKRTISLYLLAGILKNLNLASGNGFLSASVGSGFAALQNELLRLSSKFNELIYARDAEVVVSTSVDPTVSNLTLLGQLEEKARDEIALSLDTVSEVIGQEQVEALTETELRNRLKNGIDDIKADLINLCGIPNGCSLTDVFEDEACHVRVNIGECGFIYNKGEADISTDFKFNDLSTSEGGKALLAVLEAGRNQAISSGETSELLRRIEIKVAQTEGFAENIVERAKVRKEKLTTMEKSFREIAKTFEGDIAATARDLANRTKIRNDSITGDIANLLLWQTIKVASVSTQMGLEIQALTLNRAAAVAIAAGDQAAMITEAATDAIPRTDSAAAVGAIGPIATIHSAKITAVSAATATALSLESAGSVLELASNQVERYTSISLDALTGAADIATQETNNKLTELSELADAGDFKSDSERTLMRDALQVSSEESAIQLALLKETQELDDRRSDILLDMAKLAGLILREAQARVQYDQRILDYGFVAQRAQLVDAKLVDLIVQRAQVNLVVGSPSAVFQRANRIVRAENKLELAKDRLMDWLVALEYYAVRPFMDQRIQVLLARNPYQLEKIADELGRLQSACGGSVNSFTAELSLRKDLLFVTQPQVDLDGSVISPEGVFRNLLEVGYVPIDKRVRYSSDQNVGDLLASSDVLAASFYIDLADFANLGSTCNAKVSSIDIQLVGAIGEGRPTVSLLYDGTGELRSCQPGINEYVAQFGKNTTAFGAITYLKSAGRSISPVAGINEFIEESANTTLNGLPLSSQYTVLINKTAGENGKIDWTKLEDINLRVSYTYQDNFPQGQCE